MTCGGLFFLLEAFLAWAVHEQSYLLYCIPFSSFYHAILLSFILWILALCLDLLLHSLYHSYLWRLVVRWARSFLLFVPFGQLLVLLSSTILDFRWFLVDELVLEMQIQVPPWWSLSSSGVAKSCSSLFASHLDSRGRNLIGTCTKGLSPMT